MKVVFPKAGVAVVTYKTRVDSSVAGQDTSGAYNVASVWTKRVGELGPYQSRFHKESVATLLRLARLGTVCLCRASGVKVIATSSP